MGSTKNSVKAQAFVFYMANKDNVKARFLSIYFSTSTVLCLTHSTRRVLFLISANLICNGGN